MFSLLFVEKKEEDYDHSNLNRPKLNEDIYKDLIFLDKRYEFYFIFEFF